MEILIALLLLLTCFFFVTQPFFAPPSSFKRAIRRWEHVCPNCLRFFPRKGEGDRAPFVHRCDDCAAKEEDEPQGYRGREKVKS